MNEPLSQATSFAGSRVLALVLAIGLIGTGGYAVYEHHSASQMANQTAQVQASLASTNAQLADLSNRLNQLTAPKPVPQARHASGSRAHRSTAASRRALDERFGKMQTQIDAQNRAIDDQGKAIESTRQDLAGTRTELSGSIAHTHDELVVLQRKGERNYYEFDLDRAKGFHTSGPVGIRLKKSNVKHQYADLDLLVNDASLSKKHVNLLEPAVFYAEDSDLPVELVINRIGKNHIHGYVSTPKYRRSELTAQAQPVDTNSPNNTPDTSNPSLKNRTRPSAPPH